MLRWKQTPWGDSVLLPVHDEIIVMVPKHYGSAATAALVAMHADGIHGVPSPRLTNRTNRAGIGQTQPDCHSSSVSTRRPSGIASGITSGVLPGSNAHGGSNRRTQTSEDAGGHTPVDDIAGACDITAVVAGEEQAKLGNLVARPRALCWKPGFEDFLQ